MDLEFHQLDRRYERLRLRRPDKERRLLGSLAERGQQVPIVVVGLPEEENRFVVVDGYKRIRALERLGQDLVGATVWEMSQDEALVLDRSLRTAQAETPIEQGWLLAELHRSFSLSFEELARRFDRSVSWVSRRLALVEQLPETVQENVRQGKIPAHAAMKYLVPMARINRSDCQQLADAIARHGFTTQEVGQLYEGWRSGTPSMRQRLLEDPKLFVRARREIEQEEPVTPTLDKLIQDLAIAGAMARRASRQWRRIAPSIDQDERQRVSLCLQQAQSDLEKLSKQIHQEKTCVNSKPQDSDSGAASQASGETSDCTHPWGVPEGGQEGHPVEIAAAATTGSCRESRALPSRDSPALRFLQRESGPSP